MLATTTAAAANSTMPMITGRSCWLIASMAVLPSPGRLNTVSVTTTPPSSVPDVDAELGDDRGQGAAQPVPVDHPRSPIPLDRAVRM